MKVLLRFTLLVGAIFSATLASAASVSNFQSTYDAANERIQYTFDLDPVDGTTASGVDQIYFNYDPQNPPNPYIVATTTLLDASVTGTSLAVFDVDEVFFSFPSPLTTPTTIVVILGNIDPVAFSGGAYSLSLEVNPSHGPSPSSLTSQSLGVVETEADAIDGPVPPAINGSNSGAASIPTMSAYGLGLTMLGLLMVAGRRLRASSKRD